MLNVISPIVACFGVATLAVSRHLDQMERRVAIFTTLTSSVVLLALCAYLSARSSIGWPQKTLLTDDKLELTGGDIHRRTSTELNQARINHDVSWALPSVSQCRFPCSTVAM